MITHRNDVIADHFAKTLEYFENVNTLSLSRDLNVNLHSLKICEKCVCKHESESDKCIHTNSFIFDRPNQTSLSRIRCERIVTRQREQ